MSEFDIGIKWSPGHMGIEGNKAADRLADQGALAPTWDVGLPAQPTVAGIGTTVRQLKAQARAA